MDAFRDVPGAAVCAFRDGDVVDVEFYGTRCHTADALDETTVWEAASLTKPVVVELVLRLAAAGELDLDAPLTVDLDLIGAQADPRWDEVCARRVLTHTTGLPNWRGPLEALRAAGWDGTNEGEQLRFEHNPGTFGYSGEGFEVLLHALCRARGIGAVELLEAHLRGLGMHDSSFVWQPSFDDRVAIPHTSDGSALEKMRPSIARAAGSLHTTCLDYARFASTVLQTGSDEVFQPVIALDDVRGRSLGWGTIATEQGVLAWQHGDNLGFKHLVGLRRDAGDGVLVFTNSDNGVAGYRALCRRILGAEP